MSLAPATNLVDAFIKNKYFLNKIRSLMRPSKYILKVLFFIVFCGSIFAQDRTIRFAAQLPPGHSTTQGIERFKQIVERDSLGRIRVNVFPGGVLGGYLDNISGLRNGALEMAAIASPLLSSFVSDFSVFQVPFLFSNSDQVDDFLDGYAGKIIHEKLQSGGFLGLAFYEGGFSYLTNSRLPITHISDISGMRLRAVSGGAKWVAAIGGTPVELPFHELYGALSRKRVDGQENPLDVIISAKFYEVQKFISLPAYRYIPISIVVSGSFWNSLSSIEKNIIRDAAVESAKFQRAQSRATTAALFKSLTETGMQSSIIPLAQLDALRAKIDSEVGFSGEPLASIYRDLRLKVTEGERLAGEHLRAEEERRRRQAFEAQLAAVQSTQQALPSAGAGSIHSAHALVVGNAAYPGSGRLDNPVNDATAISQKLRSMGFTVTTVTDANRQRLVQAMAQFRRSAASADLSLLFYSGHGVQIFGTNYILPTDVDQTDTAQATIQGVRLNEVIENFMPGKTKIVFLDACRDNPLQRTGDRSVTKGLAPISVAEGTLISYATKDGQVAADGVGSKNSPFTQALLEHLADPQDIGVVLRKVREKVMKATGGKQQPWDYGSLTGGELVLSRIKGGKP